MKIRFDKTLLLSTLLPMAGAVSGRNTIPAIEGFHFEPNADGESCTIVAYDLEKGFKTAIPAQIDEGSDCIINAPKLLQILKLLPEGEVTITVSENKIANISVGKSEFELYALPGKDFPALPELSGDKGFSMPQKVLRKMIGQIFFGIAQNDSRAALNGAYFCIEGDRIKIISCDGNRLAIKECVCAFENHNADQSTLNFHFIVPGKALTELLKIISDKEDMVKIVFGRKHAIFCVDGMRFFCRLIDGEYIEYNRFIPRENKIFATLSASAFVGALERASLITEDRIMGQVHSIVKCNFEDDLLKVTSQSITGRVYDEIPMVKEGLDLEIGFNCKVLLEAMRACDVDTVDLELTSAQMCMIIKPHEKNENENFLFLVLPVRMKDMQ